jgi:hypothetical protein
VRALHAELERTFADHTDTALFNDAYHLTFVHHPRSYTYFYNSNHMVADWLRELGCQVRGPAYHSRWNVADPGGTD